MEMMGGMGGEVFKAEKGQNKKRGHMEFQIGSAEICAMAPANFGGCPQGKVRHILAAKL
jgi:hypothetical protein